MIFSLVLFYFFLSHGCYLVEMSLNWDQVIKNFCFFFPEKCQRLKIQVLRVCTRYQVVYVLFKVSLRVDEDLKRRVITFWRQCSLLRGQPSKWCLFILLCWKNFVDFFYRWYTCCFWMKLWTHLGTICDVGTIDLAGSLVALGLYNLWIQLMRQMQNMKWMVISCLGGN